MGLAVSTLVRSGMVVFGNAAWLLAAALALLGRWLEAAACVAFALGADMVGRVWSRKRPVPIPYFLRWVLHIPRGPHSPERIKRILQPHPPERILEVGPGVGIHALAIARSLLPGGALDVLDVQQQMLDDLMRRATGRGVTNIVPQQGDARRLPYPDQTFDAAYLIGVLGEIPDASLALRELRRVLKAGGRLLICDMLLDPDFVPIPALERMARDTGFACDRIAGPRFAYSAVLSPV